MSRSRSGSGRGSARGYGVPHGKKAKHKKQKNELASSSHAWEQKYASAAEEVSTKTLNRLHNLGTQLFASTPYSEHYDRWLSNLNDVISEFESSPTTNPDDQYINERTQILAKIQLSLEQRKKEETSVNQAAQTILETKARLQSLERQCNEETRQLEQHDNAEKLRIQTRIKDLEKELDEIDRMKTGFFRGISKKEKERRQSETKQKLGDAKRDLTSLEKDLTAQTERLRTEYQTKEQPLTKQVQEYENAADSLDKDPSLEDRKSASETLAKAVNGLLQRKKTKTPEPPTSTSEAPNEET